MLATQNYQTRFSLVSDRTLAIHWGYFAPHLVCRITGVVLPVEMCEESEASELRSGVSNAASHRKGYVSSRISLMPGSDWARWPNKGQDGQIRARWPNKSFVS